MFVHSQRSMRRTLFINILEGYASSNEYTDESQYLFVWQKLKAQKDVNRQNIGVTFYGE